MRYTALVYNKNTRVDTLVLHLKYILRILTTVKDVCTGCIQLVNNFDLALC